MNVNVIATAFDKVLLLEPSVLHDDRGYFMEIWRSNIYTRLGIPETLVQDNVSFSKKNVLRGMHFQNPHAQCKLVTCLYGSVFDVVVDVRKGSSTFGTWDGFPLSFENSRQLYIPPGFAHGFLVTSETALFLYKCTAFYDATTEYSLLWNDPDIGIQWPEVYPEISDKDRQAPRLRDLPEAALLFDVV